MAIQDDQDTEDDAVPPSRSFDQDRQDNREAGGIQMHDLAQDNFDSTGNTLNVYNSMKSSLAREGGSDYAQQKPPKPR